MKALNSRSHLAQVSSFEAFICFSAASKEILLHLCGNRNLPNTENINTGRNRARRETTTQRSWIKQSVLEALLHLILLRSLLIAIVWHGKSYPYNALCYGSEQSFHNRLMACWSGNNTLISSEQHLYVTHI